MYWVEWRRRRRQRRVKRLKVVLNDVSAVYEAE
jgi:hypothetical protein